MFQDRSEALGCKVSQGKISTVLMTLHRTPGQRNRVRDGAVLANKKRVIKMLVIVVLLFSLSWLPYQVHLFRITLIKLLVFSSCFVLYTIFVSLCLKTNSMIMPSSLFHSCFSCIALSSLFFADLLHGGLDDAFHQPVQVHQPALSPLPLVCRRNSETQHFTQLLKLQPSS